ncbi:N-acetyltransferase [Streptomyces sp. NPDC001027]|uniref:N-acetyltransferase n=1 Tax=Streptomyces sp. NPDC001027 TaxID=3154771 RepID=UPI003329267A
MIRTHGPGQVPPMLDTIADIWSDAHPELVDTPRASTDGLSATALRRQVTSHLRHEGFTLGAAYASGSMVGFGYAFPCTPARNSCPRSPNRSVRAASWACASSQSLPPGSPRASAPASTPAIDPDYASLLVRPGNTAGRTLYERLGYAYAGPYRNEPGGPVYDLLLLKVDSEAVAQ